MGLRLCLRWLRRRAAVCAGCCRSSSSRTADVSDQKAASCGMVVSEMEIGRRMSHLSRRVTHLYCGNLPCRPPAQPPARPSVGRVKGSTVTIFTALTPRARSSSDSSRARARAREFAQWRKKIERDAHAYILARAAAGN
jgi:hypothetical protein